jgi:hypothetical protein
VALEQMPVGVGHVRAAVTDVVADPLREKPADALQSGTDRRHSEGTGVVGGLGDNRLAAEVRASERLLSGGF